MQKRRRFTQEYKREAVELTKSADVTISQVARELGLNANMLGRWVREQGKSGGKAFPGQGKPRDEEIAGLKRELARVRKERDFLQEAAAFFAKTSR